MSKFSENGKFEIIEHQTDDDSYFYSDTDYSYYVASVETGDELFDFYGHSYSGRGGVDKGGVKKISFENDKNSIKVEHYDGEIEHFELPIEVTFADKGKAILLKYQNGNTEKRKRKAITHFSKYGQSYSPSLKKPK